MREAAKWIVGEMMRDLKDRGLEPEEIPFPPEALSSLIGMAGAGKITAASAKKVFGLLFDEGGAPEGLVEKYGLAVIGDESAIDTAIEETLGENPKSVADYLSGKEKAFGFLMGQCMRRLHGKADPAVLRQKLAGRLSQG